MRRLFPERLQDLPAVHAGHVDVDERDVEPLACLQGLDRVQGIRAEPDLLDPRGMQASLHAVQEVLFVVDDNDGMIHGPPAFFLAARNAGRIRILVRNKIVIS